MDESSDIIKELTNKIDYKKVEDIKIIEIRKSYDFLKNAVGNI